MTYILGLRANPVIDSGLVPPIIELTVAQDAYPPTGTIEFDRSNISTDTWRFQVSTNFTFTALVIDATGTVGTGDIGLSGLSAISSGKHYFRARIERDGAPGAWSSLLVHGDLVTPTITSANSLSIVENVPLALALTSDKDPEVNWSVFGGADAGQFEVASSTLRFLSNGTKDYENPTDFDFDSSYNVTVRADDLAGNFAIQDVVIPVTNDPSDDPRNTVWNTRTGANKHGLMTVSGTPPLHAVGTAGLGAAMMVRAKRAAQVSKLQWETAITAINASDQFYMGLDDGTTSFASPAVPGFSGTEGVTFVVTDSETYYWYGGIQAFVGGLTNPKLVDDVFTITADEATGQIKLFRTRSGITVQIGPTVTVTPWSSFFAFAGTNGIVAQTANFGATSFARALDAGYDAY